MFKIFKIIFYWVLFLSMQGCNRKKNIQIEDEFLDAKGIIELIEKNGELIFKDSSAEKGDSTGDNCVLKLKKNYQIEFSSAAYNIYTYEGEFQIVGEDIIITLQKGGGPFSNEEPDVLIWPPLKLKPTLHGYKLIRKDGRSDFKEHWNIYEDRVNHIFPLIQFKL